MLGKNEKNGKHKTHLRKILIIIPILIWLNQIIIQWLFRVFLPYFQQRRSFCAFSTNKYMTSYYSYI